MALALDRKTFGASPARIYLAETLNRVGSPKLARKVASRLGAVDRLAAELAASQSVGALSSWAVGSLCGAVEDKARHFASVLRAAPVEGVSPEDLALVCDVAENAMLASAKSLRKRAKSCKDADREASRTVPDGVAPPRASIADFSDPSAASRAARAERRAKARGRDDGFYA